MLSLENKESDNQDEMIKQLPLPKSIRRLY